MQNATTVYSVNEKIFEEKSRNRLNIGFIFLNLAVLDTNFGFPNFLIFLKIA